MVVVSTNPQQRVESTPMQQTQPGATTSTERGVDFSQVSLGNFSFSSSLFPQAGFPDRSAAQFRFSDQVRFPSTVTDSETPLVSSSPSQSITNPTPAALPVQQRQPAAAEPPVSPQGIPPVSATPDNTPRQNAPVPVGEVIAGLMRGVSFPPGTTFTYPDGRTGVLVGDGQGNAAPAHVTASALARAIGFASPQAFLAAQPQTQPSQPVNPGAPPNVVQPPEQTRLNGDQPQAAVPQSLPNPQQTPVSTGRILRIPTDGS